MGDMENKSLEEKVRELEEKLQVQKLQARLEIEDLEQKLRVKELQHRIETPPDHGQPQRWFSYLIWGLVILILLFALATSFLRLRIADEGISGDETGSDTQAELALERSEEAIESVNLLLSFLEGASVLLALALGAAAIYGYRQTNQVREEVSGELQKAQEARAVIESRRTQLERLGDLENHLNATEESLRDTINDVSRLLQADQEFRRSNHEDAYRFVNMVLEHDEDNPQALYIAGWLETHHILGKQEEGIDHLKRLLEIEVDWPSAMAAYGVALRRKAIRLRDQKGDQQGFNNLMNKAVGQLHLALGQSPQLVDFNQESFWGPVGGIMRDLGRIDEGIEAYKKALKITPGSSYPQGNLATLLLQKAQQTGTEEAVQEALRAYRETLRFAEVELSINPNDYFLIMDMAMSKTILAFDNPGYFEDARRNLEQALEMSVTLGALSTSRRGWNYLRDYLPDDPKWKPVEEAIERAINKIDEVIATHQPQSDSSENKTGDGSE
jgi:tetratricopeptide (TPR) repeat protein